MSDVLTAVVIIAILCVITYFGVIYKDVLIPKTCDTVCLNGGAVNSKCECVCPSPYSGTNCQNRDSAVSTCDTICFNGGAVNPKTCECVCPAPFTGANCQNKPANSGGSSGSGGSGGSGGSDEPDETGGGSGNVLPPLPDPVPVPIPDPVCTGKCYNGGVMNQDNCKCMCTSQWTGSDCSSRVCSGKCVNGTFDDNCRCQCNPDYIGSDCSIRSCANVPCVHGTLDSNCTCICDPKYEGKSCNSLICTNTCVYGQLQPDCTCKCDSTHQGLACDQKICDPYKCGIRGVPDANCNCQCSLGWKGETCSVRECSQTTCLNGGTPDANCVCICPTNYSGADCSIYTAPILPPPPPPPPVITDNSIVSIKISIGSMNIGFKYESITFTANNGVELKPTDSTYGYTTTIKPTGNGYWVVDFKFNSPINLEKIKVVNTRESRELLAGMYGCMLTMANKSNTNKDICWLTFHRITEFIFKDGKFVRRVITKWTPTELQSLGGSLGDEHLANNLVKTIMIGSSFNPSFKFDSLVFVDIYGNIMVKDDPLNGFDVQVKEDAYGYNYVNFVFRTPFKVGQITVNNNRMRAYDMKYCYLIFSNEWGSQLRLSYVPLTSDKSMIITYENVEPVNMTSIPWPPIVSSENAPTPVSSAPGTKVGYVTFQSNSGSGFILAEVFLYAGNRDLKKKDVIITESNNQYYYGSNIPDAIFDKSPIYSPNAEFGVQPTFTTGGDKILQIRLLTPTVLDVIQIIGDATSWISSMNATMHLMDVNNVLIVSIPLKKEFSQAYVIKNNVPEYVGTGPLPPLIT